MRSAAAAEADSVKKPAPPPTAPKRSAKPAAAKAPPKKRAAPAPRRKPPAEPAATPRSRSSLRDAGVALAVLLAVALAASGAILLRDRHEQRPSVSSAAVAVTPGELAARADELGTPVYWAGTFPGRLLELTSSATGAFVRYLPAGTTVGGEDRTLTIATYPMRDAYATAARRAKGAGMTSRPTRNGGLAVWSASQPTSVYVAWRGVPSLVEVYAPRSADARATALGGRVRPVG